MARDADLQRLKEARAAAKRKCTRTFNILTANLEEDCLESAETSYERLKNQEFPQFETAFDAFESALEELEDKAQDEDFTSLGAYFQQVAKLVSQAEKLIHNAQTEAEESQADAQAKSNLADAKRKLEDDFNLYKWQRAEVMEVKTAYEEKSVDDLKNDTSVRVTLSVLEKDHSTLKLKAVFQ